MSFQQAVVGALREGRVLAEALMVDSCVVTRATDGDPDPVTGAQPRVEVYAGRAKSQTFQAYEQTPESGEARVTVQRYYVHFPVGAFVPEVGDVVEWTDCPLDESRVGIRERVTAPFSKTLATATRVSTDRIAGDV